MLIKHLSYARAVELELIVKKLMYRFWGVFCSCLLLTNCAKNNDSLESLAQDKHVKAYFNHRQTEKQTFVDPYRQIERSGDNLEAVIIQEIANAKSSIDLAVQELNLPLVAHALAKQQKLGIKVRVILDNNYSRSLAELSSTEIKNLNRRDRQKYERFIQLVDRDRNGYLSESEIRQQDAISILRQAGIEIIDDTADGSKGSGLMHHKFMVIDRQIVVLGSANFTLSGLLGDIDKPMTRGNVNHLLRIDIPEFASLFREEFDYMWGNDALKITSKFGLAKPWRSPKTVNWKHGSLTVQFAPTSRKQPWSSSTNGLIAKVIEEAESSIDLALFVFSEQELADLLQSKFQAGVTIRGVFDAGFAYRYYSEVLDLLGIFRYFRCQTEAHNNPWINSLNTVGTASLSSGDKLHHKFTVIDNETVISGSQNWSQAANLTNDESVVIIRSPKVSEHFVREFKRIYSVALLAIPTKVESQIEQQQQKCE